MKNTPHSNRRTLERLKRWGFDRDLVQGYEFFSGTRYDFFNIIDVATISPRFGLIGIQACLKRHLSETRTRLETAKISHTWLASGLKLQIWSWRQLANGHWEPRIEFGFIEDGIVKFDLLRDYGMFNQSPPEEPRRTRVRNKNGGTSSSEGSVGTSSRLLQDTVQ